MMVQWSEKVRGAEHRSQWVPWKGAENHVVATEWGTVEVYAEGGKWPFVVLSVICRGRRYSSGMHRVRRMPTPTGVARMAGRFARMVAEQAGEE